MRPTLDVPPPINDDEILLAYQSSPYVNGVGHDDETLSFYFNHITECFGGEALCLPLINSLKRQPEGSRGPILDHFSETLVRWGLDRSVADFRNWFRTWRGSAQGSAATCYRNFIRAVNGAGGSDTVVFCAVLPHFVIIREALALRQRGWKVFLVCQGYPSFMGGIIENLFNEVARVPDWRLGELIRMLAPTVFHVQCWQYTYEAALPVIFNARGTPVVCEFYDITSLYASREAFYRWEGKFSDNWTPRLADADIAAERFILHHAQGVVTRFPPDVVAQWMAEHDADVPHAEMHPFAVPEFAAYCDEKLSAKDGVTRLVMGGQIVDDTSLTCHRMCPEAGTVDAFDSLLRQGFAVTALSMSKLPSAGPLRELADRHPRFQMRPGVPFPQLARTIADHDYGTMLTKLRMEELWVRDELMRGGVGTKLFSFFEAGLPALVNAEYEEMARIVTSNRLGLAVRAPDIDNLRNILADFDYQACVANVKRYNLEQSMRVNINRLLTLYEQASERAGGTPLAVGGR